MGVRRSPAKLLIDLDRKVSRAMECGRGLTLSPDQLDALAAIGMVAKLAEAKAAILMEEARCRQTREESISGAGSGSTSNEARAESLPAVAGISGGMIPAPATNGARARARVTFD